MKQENKIKVSIIVPVYNAREYITNCLESLLNQTLKDIEIICVDDKSTDNSVKIIEDFMKRDKRKTLIKNDENRFASYCRNRGITEATGEYIGFIDNDDFVDKDFYERLYDTAKIYNADVTMGEIKILDSNTNKVFLERKNDVGCEYLMIKMLNKLKEGVAWDKIYRTSFLQNNTDLRFPENIILGEDNLFVFKVLCECNKLVFTSGSFYYWCRRKSSAGLSPKYEELRTQSAFKVLEYVIEYLKNKLYSMDDAGIVLNWMLHFLALYAFKDPHNRDCIEQKMMEVYPNLRLS